MTEGFTFIHNQWFWPATLVAILMWSVFIWKEWSYVKTRTFYIHIGIAFIAVLSILFIALKPAMSVIDQSAKVVLLTPNYNETQLDSLIRENKGITIKKYTDTKPILDTIVNPESLYVLGEGIRPFDLWQLKDIPVLYLGGDQPEGITRIKYKTTEKVGNLLKIYGSYQNNKLGHQLMLTNPAGQQIDSLLLSEDDNTFQLQALLHTKGDFLFTLSAKDSIGHTITEDPIPISVTERSPLTIAIINEYPTFETKYLKNYLAEKGHHVLIRSQLTTSRFKYEYFNMEHPLDIRFTEEKLAHFDLLIIDRNSLQRLSRENRRILEKVINETGLGLFIQSDADVYSSTLPISSLGFLQKKQTSVILDDFPKTTIDTYPYTIKNRFGVTNLYSHQTGILAAYQQRGAGRVGVSVFQNTYGLLLNGKTEAYQSLWTTLITEVSKSEYSDASWNINHPWTYMNEPFAFELRTQLPEPIVTTKSGQRIPLQQDIVLQNIWKGTTYPDTLGWHRNHVVKDSTHILNYYVIDSTHWKPLKSAQVRMANQRYFNNQDATDIELKSVMQPINRLWFFIIFIACMGYLWLKPKL